MRSAFVPILILIALLFLAGSVKEKRFEIPPKWPGPTFDFKKIPQKKEIYSLGKKLFYDPILSRDSSISCENCHLSYTAFTHADHRLSHGIYGLIGKRNAPALINLAWGKEFMWDGRAKTLTDQIHLPIIDPREMDERMERVTVKLKNSAAYRKKFKEAFGDSMPNAERLSSALALFVANLVSFHSKYDSVVNKWGTAVFDAQEQRGYTLFKMHCSSCHKEPLFTDHSFRNNGLLPDTGLKDIGRMIVTGKRNDSLKFKVPTLRNIEFSGPYFHDGRISKLKDAIEHYNSGIHSTRTLDEQLKNGITLNKQDKRDLIAFLTTLTDKFFLYNVQFRPND